jgi:hypothetical protein
MKLIIKIAAGIVLAVVAMNLFSTSVSKYRCSHNMAPEVFEDWCLSEREARDPDFARVKATDDRVKALIVQDKKCDHIIGLNDKDPCLSKQRPFATGGTK